MTVADDRLRDLERHAQTDPEAEVRLLVERERAGQTTPDRLGLAALLGHGGARDALSALAFPLPRPGPGLDGLFEAVDRLGLRVALAVARALTGGMAPLAERGTAAAPWDDARGTLAGVVRRCDEWAGWVEGKGLEELEARRTTLSGLAGAVRPALAEASAGPLRDHLSAALLPWALGATPRPAPTPAEPALCARLLDDVTAEIVSGARDPALQAARRAEAHRAARLAAVHELLGRLETRAPRPGLTCYLGLFEPARSDGFCVGVELDQVVARARVALIGTEPPGALRDYLTDAPFEVGARPLPAAWRVEAQLGPAARNDLEEAMTEVHPTVLTDSHAPGTQQRDGIELAAEVRVGESAPWTFLALSPWQGEAPRHAHYFDALLAAARAALTDPRAVALLDGVELHRR